MDGGGNVDSDDYKIVEQVMDIQEQIGQNLVGRGNFDVKVDDGYIKGTFFASHAEKKMSILSPNQPIVIKCPSVVCDNCLEYFEKLAKYSNKTQIVINIG